MANIEKRKKIRALEAKRDALTEKQKKVLLEKRQTAQALKAARKAK